MSTGALARRWAGTPTFTRVSAYAPIAAIFLVQLVLFPLPLGEWVRGLIIGGLTALIALGMALTYQSNRVVSFAQADLGVAPVVLVFLLIDDWGWPWIAASLSGLVIALLLGAIVELAVIRRFRDAPRLILTVATLGLAQLLAGLALILPELFDETFVAPRVEPPFNLEFTVAGTNFFTYDVLALIAVPAAVALLALLLRRTDIGLATRAIADRGERAQMLGVPVGRVQTSVWSLAALLAFVAVFLRAGVLGLPVGGLLSLDILLRALAALLIGRFTNLPVVAGAAVALGTLEIGVRWHAVSTAAVDPVLAAVIIGALLLRRRQAGRDASEVSSWRASEDVRPVPRQILALPSVRALQAGAMAIVVAMAVALPLVLSIDQTLKAGALLVYMLLGCSIVVLTGWTGLVSLGQIGLFALGSAVGAVVTSTWDLDLSIALLLSALAGAAAAVVIGFPALRLRGIELGVVTLAASLAISSWLLNPVFFDWVPEGRIERPPLFGRIDIDSPARIYYLILVVLGLVLLGLRGIRRSRTGRALLALRDNERGAQAYGLSTVRLRLTSFALSGSLAGLAGALFVHHQQAIGEQPYFAGENFTVFTMVVLGGIATPLGAVLGALWMQGTRWFLPGEWQLLASGFGVLLVLLILPGGLGGLVLQLRDRWLARIAVGRGLDVPGYTPASLDVDQAEDAEAESDAVLAAVEATEAHDEAEQDAPATISGGSE